MAKYNTTNSDRRSARTVSDSQRVTRDDIRRASGALLLAAQLLAGCSSHKARMQLAKNLQTMMPDRCINAGRAVKPVFAAEV
jgi:hypothetical protein